MDRGAGRVFLVGAGPGAPSLITVRGAELLRHAEVVVYDDCLVSQELLALASDSAELICAGEQIDAGTNIDPTDLTRLLIDRAREGKQVVRLSNGDPFIFGRGGHEAEALAEAEIDFEVVPGIASATAAPAMAGIPLTHGKSGSFIAFLHAKGDAGNPQGSSVPWTEAAATTRVGGTLVLLMSDASLRESLVRLAGAGLPAATPAAVVQWAAAAAQRSIIATLETLADQVEQAKMGTPSVVVIGKSAARAPRLAWLERTPLFGRRIVVTRARASIGSFAGNLRALGAEVIEFPTIQIVAPESYEIVDRALERLGSFDWIIFTSASGVEAFIARIKARDVDLRAIGGARLGAIGPATAARLADYALRVQAIPGEYRAEALVDAIGAKDIRGARILIPRAQVAREVLPEMLGAAGAREVLVAPVYKTVKPRRAPVRRVQELATAGAVDLAAFTSSSTVANFCEMVGAAARGLKAAAIGPITAETARRSGLEVAVCPSEYTVAALTAAIGEYFSGLSDGGAVLRSDVHH